MCVCRGGAADGDWWCPCCWTLFQEQSICSRFHFLCSMFRFRRGHSEMGVVYVGSGVCVCLCVCGDVGGDS